MYYEWRPYVPVAQRKANAAKQVKKKLSGKAQPVEIDGKKIAKTFWGAAWCDNLESYSDFSNRLPRGRTYVRNGSVVHLEIAEGRIEAYVAGSELYKIKIEIAPLKPSEWKGFKAKCAGEIASLVELLQGKLSKNTLSIITHRDTGLFPSPKEIKLDCSCPDWAVMCKHVSAVLYGVGARLDSSPELFFKLRGVDHLELIDTTVAIPRGKKDDETLDASSLGDIFGVELSDGLEGEPLGTATARPAVSGTLAKKSAKKAAKKTTRKVVKKTVRKKAAKKAVGKKRATKKKTAQGEA